MVLRGDSVIIIETMVDLIMIHIMLHGIVEDPDQEAGVHITEDQEVDQGKGLLVGQGKGPQVVQGDLNDHIHLVVRDTKAEPHKERVGVNPEVDLVKLVQNPVPGTTEKNHPLCL